MAMTDAFLLHAVRSSLVDMLDKSLMVVLRDGRKIIGTLRTFDQYSNIVLQDSVERKVFEDMFHDASLDGLYLVRGENIVMMGDMDAKEKEKTRALLREVTAEVLAKAIADKKKATPASAAANEGKSSFKNINSGGDDDFADF